jgi:hypothetical protein
VCAAWCFGEDPLLSFFGGVCFFGGFWAVFPVLLNVGRYYSDCEFIGLFLSVLFGFKYCCDCGCYAFFSSTCFSSFLAGLNCSLPLLLLLLFSELLFALLTFSSCNSRYHLSIICALAILKTHFFYSCFLS